MAIYLTLALTFFNFVGAGAARVVLTLYALELGAPASAVGVIGGLLFLFPLLLSWPIGALADRTGARGLLLFASACGAFSLALPYFAPGIVAFYVAAALNGLALAFFHVTLQNLIGILSRPEERPRNFSNFSITGALTSFFGPLLAGFAIDHLGFGLACLATAFQYVVAIGLLLGWGRLFPPANPHAPKDMTGGSMLGNSEVRRVLVIGSLVQLGYDLFQFYLPIYAHSIGLSATIIGTILAALAVAALAVRLFLPALIKKLGEETLLAWAFLAGTAGYALVPLFSDALALGAVTFFFGLGMGIGIPLTVILMYSHSPAGRSGQALGLRLTVNNFVRVTGPMAFGVVGSAFGLAWVFWIVAAFMAAGGVFARATAARVRP